MTTIAYKNGIMAADTLVTGGDIRRGYVDKLRQLADGGLVGIAGSAGWEEPIVQWLNTGRWWPDRPIFPEGVDIYGLLVGPTGRIHGFSRHMRFTPVDGDFGAQGSGNELALGAMAAGASAEEAVAIAAQFDVYTGGRITTLSLPSPSRPTGG